MIERWKFNVDSMSDCYCDCELSAIGPYVLHQDHLAAVQDLEAEVKRLKTEIKDWILAFAKNDDQVKRVEKLEAENKELAKTCEWKEVDLESGHYETECKEAFVFNEGNRSDNNCSYCQYCGGKVTERSPEAG